MKTLLFLPALAFGLSGCAGLRSNVSGSWECRAGQGTCEPVASIDDRAIRQLGGSAEAVPMSSGTATPAPARQPLLAPFSGDAVPGRSDEKVLRIVFPAHVDAAGLFHEPSAVHAVVEAPGWVPPATPARAPRPASDAPSSGAQAAPGPSPRLATPEEAQRLAAGARPLRPPFSAGPSATALEAGAAPAPAAKGFPPFPAPATGSAPAAPAPVPTPGAGAISSLPPAYGSPAPAGPVPPAPASPAPATAAPAPVRSSGTVPGAASSAVVGLPRLSPGDPPDTGARLLNQRQLARLGSAPVPQTMASSEAEAGMARIRLGLAPALARADEQVPPPGPSESGDPAGPSESSDP